MSTDVMTPGLPALRWALPLVYAVSGACSLIYELVWMRQLSLVFGSGFTAVSVVTAVFFAGLAAGGALGSRLSRTALRPVRLYGLLELGITIAALLVPPALSLMEQCYAAWYPAVSASLWKTACIRLVLASALLLIPTSLMGATVPVIIRCYSTREGRNGGDSGLIYAMNALGAAAGVLSAGCVLFRVIGVEGTSMIAVGGNALVAALALALSRKEQPQKQRAGDVLRPLPADRNARRLLLCFAISGFLYIGYELVWIRVFLLFFRDSVYLYAASLGAVIAGVAAGSAVSGAVADRLSSRQNFLGALFAGAAVLQTAFLLGIVHLHRPLSMLSFRYPLLETLVIFLVLIPPFAVSGGSFPVVTRLLSQHARESGSHAGRAYAVNTVGSLAAALLTPFLLLPLLGLDGTVWLLGACGLAAALLAWLGRDLFPCVRNMGLCCLAAAMLLMASERQQGIFSDILNQLRGDATLIDAEQGVLGSNWVLKTSGPEEQTVLYENLVAFSRGGSPSFVIQGFIPLLLAEKTPKSVLGLCFGGGMTYYATRFFPDIQDIDLIDISSGNVDMALKYLPVNDALKKDARVRFFIDDAYSYTKYAEKNYDLILIDSNPPFYSHACATLYSREFYSCCARRLNPGGLFTQVLPIKQMTLSEATSVLRTFASVFPHCLLWWNELDPLMIGSCTPFSLNMNTVEKRLDNPATAQALRRFSGVAKFDTLGHFLSGLLLADDSFRAAAGSGPLNTIDRNLLEYSQNPLVDQNIVPLLRQHLIPFRQAAGLFVQPDVIHAYENNLEQRRDFLLGTSQRKMMLAKIRL